MFLILPTLGIKLFWLVWCGGGHGEEGRRKGASLGYCGVLAASWVCETLRGSEASEGEGFVCRRFLG